MNLRFACTVLALLIAGCASPGRNPAQVEDRPMVDAAQAQFKAEREAAERKQAEQAAARARADEEKRRLEEQRLRDELARVAREDEEARAREEQRRLEELARAERERQETLRQLDEQRRREELAQAEREEATRQLEESRRREELALAEREEARRLAEQKRLAQELDDFRRALEEQKAREEQLRRERDEAQRPADGGRRSLDAASVRRLGREEEIAGHPAKDRWGELRDPAGLLSRRTIYFDYDKYAIDQKYVPLIEAHARFLLENPDLNVVIEGNCDDRGSREYNLSLGAKRAESVRRALVLLGVEQARIEAVSLGAEKPVAFGQEEESWAKNRRSEIVYPDEPQ
jgi:peptidoglycan-associated lipoprotein